MIINEVELASDLAHAKLIEFAEQNLGIQDENDLYEHHTEEDETRYKEDN